MAPIVGRDQEQEMMRQLLQGNKSEFVAVYGRRRVGKTFLIRNVYEKDIVFQMTGIANMGKEQQLSNFFTTFKASSKHATDDTIPGNWFDAFEMLKKSLAKATKKESSFF